jgi:hypothetical protein
MEDGLTPVPPDDVHYCALSSFESNLYALFLTEINRPINSECELVISIKVLNHEWGYA